MNRARITLSKLERDLKLNTEILRNIATRARETSTLSERSVPQAMHAGPLVYLVGQVSRPGTYSLLEGAALSPAKLIASAGGFTATGDARLVRVTRSTQRRGRRRCGFSTWSGRTWTRRARCLCWRREILFSCRRRCEAFSRSRGNIFVLSSVSAPIMKTSRMLCVLGLVLGLAGAARALDAVKWPATVEVVFFEPEKFTDVRDGYMGSDKGRDATLDMLKDYLTGRAVRGLTAGQKLAITVMDVDLAGDFEPWRGSQWGDVRIVKEICIRRGSRWRFA